MNISMSVEKIGAGIFDVAGKTVVANQRLRNKMNDFTSVWRQSEPAMKQNTIDVWAMGQSSWLALKDDYVAWKAKRGYSTLKNVRTGKMKSAMETGQNNFPTPMLWTWGIDRTAGMWYEGKSSTPYPEHANEKRPFMITTKRLIDTVQNNMKKYILKLFKGQG